MNEDFDDGELKNEVILEICEIKSSPVLTIDTSCNDFCDEVNEVSSSGLTLVIGDHEEFVIENKHLLTRDSSNSSGDDLTCDLRSDSHTLNTIIPKMPSESDSAQAKRGPSPLLFTPVKGENTHGAGYLTQNTNSISTPSNGNCMELVSKNCFPPVLTSPPPNVAGRFVLSTTPNNLSAEKYVIRSHQCEGRFSPNKGGIPEVAIQKEIQIRHNSSTSNNLEGIISPRKTFTNKECANTLLILSPHTEKLPHELSPSSPDSLLLRKCLLERHLKFPPSESIIGREELTVKPAVPSSCDSFRIDTPKKEERMKTSDEPNSHKPSRAPLHLRKRRKHRLRTLLSRARHSLNGIPPPPSVTIPQMTVTEMLEKLRGLEFSVTGPSVTPEFFKNSSNVDSEDNVSLFHPTATEKDIVDMTWPAVLDCVHLGVCYNLGCSSEALEDICQQVREKYVGNETASSCTVWSMPRSSEESLSKQRRHDTLQASSTAREGYITRRRRAFSLASLTTAIPSIASKGRQILVNGMLRMPKEAKKTQSKHKREYDGNRVAKKEDTKRSVSKRCFGDKGKHLSKLNSIKRSLSFDGGPDNQAQSSTGSAPKSFSSSHQTVSSLLMSTKRVLTFDGLTKASDVCSTQNRITATNSFSSLPGNSDNGLASDSQDHRRSQSFSASDTIKELSEVHKKKLLWAVAEALRSRGLGTGHEKFKVCAIPLFRHCRGEFLRATNNGKETCVKSDGNDESKCHSKSVSVAESHKESTSDKMLSIALGVVDKIMNEVGVCPVVKERATLT